MQKVGKEVMAHSKAAELGIAPAILDAWMCQNEGSIVSMKKDYDLAIEVDPEFYRPHELTDLVGNPRKAREQLGWTSEYDIDKLIDEMILNS